MMHMRLQAVCHPNLPRPQPSTHRVVVLQERDRPGGPPPQQPRRLALVVAQPPVLVALKDGVHDALGGDVKRGGEAPRGIDPVHRPLPVPVLVAGREGGGTGAL